MNLRSHAGTLLVAFNVLAMSTVCSGETYTVCPDGCDFANIADAISDSQSGDTLVVKAGTYHIEQALSIDVSLTIKGEVDGDGVIQTVLVNVGPHGTIYSNTSADGVVLELENLVFENGSDESSDLLGDAYSAIGVFGTDLNMSNCVFRRNPVSDSVLHSHDSEVNLTGVKFIENGMADGQVDVVTGKASFVAFGCAVTLDDCEFRGNRGRVAGACHFDECSMNITNCLFIDNSTVEYAAPGAALMQNPSGQCSVTGSDFIGNTGVIGAILIVALGPVDSPLVGRFNFSDCEITDNVGEFSSLGTINSQVRMSDCMVERNTGTSAAGLAVTGSSDAVLENCSISQNDALISGAGIWCVDSVLKLLQCEVTGNRLSVEACESEECDFNGGAGIVVESGVVTLESSRVCGNLFGGEEYLDQQVVFADPSDDSEVVNVGSCITASCDDCSIDSDQDGLADEFDPYPFSPWDDGIEDDDELWVVPGMNIQGAIDFVVEIREKIDIETINFGDGTYLVQLDLRNLSLTLQPDEDGAEVILDALLDPANPDDISQRFWNVVNPGRCEFIGLTMINGFGYGNGGAMQLRYDYESPVLIDVTIRDCEAGDGHGGAIYCSSSASFELRDSEIYGNSASQGGGIYIQSGSNFNESGAPVLIENCVICGNVLYDDTPSQVVGIYNGSGNTILDQCIPDESGSDEIPVPNPVPNGDGTFVWYVGNNLQFPVIQSVIDVAGPGDEIVVLSGLYTESLHVDVPDLVIRPATTPGADSADGGFQSITFWNPTQGPNAGNDEAIRLGPNTSNTTVGRPPEFTILANGAVVPTQVPVGGSGMRNEYTATAFLVEVCNIDYTNLSSMTRMQRGLAGHAGDELAFNIWSRSIDKVGVRAHDAQATVSHVSISTENGFGGGISLTGESNATSFVNCTVTGTRSGGQLNDGSPVHAVYIADGAPLFTGCTIDQNIGSVDGVILQEGGSGSWIGCSIGGTFGNMSPVSNGTMVIRDGAHPTILDSTFSNNLSRFGTIRFDSTLNGSHQPLLISNTIFDENETTDGQYGAIAYCTDAVAGRSPLLVMDRVVCSNTGQSGGTQNGTEWYETDVVSNYAPRYRILRDVSSNVINADTQPAGVAANSGGDGSGMVEVSADLNGDGIVNGQDLAIILGAWTP